MPQKSFQQLQQSKQRETEGEGVVSLKNVVLAIAILASTLAAAQDIGQEVEGLTLVALSTKSVRLNWEPAPTVECQTAVTYSVFRGTTEDFTPSPKNRIASGITRTTYIATEPAVDRDYYYDVTAVVTAVPCTPRSGTIVVYPLDLGETFSVWVGNKFGQCTATSVSEITCGDQLPDFHAIIAEQNGHDYLLGCRSADFNYGNMNCANLTPRVYHVTVHSQTVTVWDSGQAEVSTKTGKTLFPITPVFSVLARLK